MGELFSLPRGIEMRWASPENPNAERGMGGKTQNGRKGRPCRGFIQAGETWTILDTKGPGTIRHIWMTSNQRDPDALRGVVLRFFWDGSQKPAIEVPWGDFFGCPLGRVPTFSNAWFDAPEGRSFNSRLPMPFRKSCRVEIENQGASELMVWYEIDFTIGDAHDENTPYLHAHFHHENPTVLKQDFEILPKITGRGRFLGCNVGVVTNKADYNGSWFGEGEVKIFLDGDTEFPTLCGTGTEDYIHTAWGQGVYSLPSYGCPIADHERGHFAFYRCHDYDPIYFQKEIRVTIQQIGCVARDGFGAILERLGEVELACDRAGEIATIETLESQNGFVLFERSDDWCATAYFYLDSPQNDLQPLENYAARTANLVAVNDAPPEQEWN